MQEEIGISPTSHNKNWSFGVIVETYSMRGMYRVCVCGHFAFGQNKLNGQTIKTKILTEELESKLGENEVLKYDTCGGVRNLFTLPKYMFLATRKTENLIILPAYKGLRMSAFILSILRLFSRRCRIHYVVIGAWLPSFLRKNPLLKFFVKRAIDLIYVETTTMLHDLEQMGFANLALMPNCKDLMLSSADFRHWTEGKPLKLCIFSRVMKGKGIAEAVSAVRSANKKLWPRSFSLDIYGPIERGEEAWFEDLQRDFPEYVRYGGMVPFDESTKVLQNYFALLFPTLFYTEGVPGTIIDAYAAGLPVVASKWQSFADVVDDGITGWGYPFGDLEALVDLLEELGEHPEKVDALRPNCLRRASDFKPARVLNVLLERLQ